MVLQTFPVKSTHMLHLQVSLFSWPKVTDATKPGSPGLPLKPPDYINFSFDSVFRSFSAKSSAHKSAQRCIAGLRGRENPPKRRCNDLLSWSPLVVLRPDRPKIACALDCPSLLVRRCTSTFLSPDGEFFHRRASRRSLFAAISARRTI